MKKVIFLFVFCFVAFTTCKKDDSDNVDNSGLVYSSSTKAILTPDFNKYFVSIDTSNYSLILKKEIVSIYKFQVNDILLSDFEGGLLRKISKITTLDGDNVKFETVEASICEAIKQGEAQLSISPGAIDPSKIKYLSNGVSVAPSLLKSTNSNLDIKVIFYDEDGNFNTTDDQVKLEGFLGTHMDITDFAFKIRDFNLEKFKIDYSITNETSLALTIDGSIKAFNRDKLIKEKPLFEIPLGDYPIPAMPAIILSPTIEVVGGFDFDIFASLKTSMSYQEKFTTGILYQNNEWSTTKDITKNFSFISPTLTGNAGVQAYIKPKFLLKINKVLSPKVSGKIYADAKVTLGSDPWWTIYGGVQIGAGVEMKVWTKSLFDVNFNLYDYRILLGQSTTPQNQAPLQPSNSNPANNATGISTSPTLTWDCSDPDGDPLTYDVYFGTTNPPTAKVSPDQTAKSLARSGLANNTPYYWQVTAKDNKGNSTSGPIWKFITVPAPNQAPVQPFNPNPANNTTGTSTSLNLSWDCSDPDGDPLTYDVYFGTTNPPTTKVSPDQTAKNLSRSGLANNTPYYWQVTAKDNKGNSTSGPIWKFTTIPAPNLAPLQPSNPSPADNATDVSTSGTLNWTCSDPENDPLIYDIFFGTSPNPTTKVKADQIPNTYAPTDLTANTYYYWKIVAKDNKGNSTTGPIWSFKTSSSPWTYKSPMPFRSFYFNTVVINDKFYAIQCGQDPKIKNSVIYVYDPIADSWVLETTFPDAIYNSGSTIVGDNIYIFGGEYTVPRGSDPSSTVKVYETKTKTWKYLAPMPTKRFGSKCIAIDGKIYVFGGGAVADTRIYNNVEAYNTNTDTWEVLKSMPTARANMAIVTLFEKIYIMFGQGSYILYNSIYIYDIVSNNYTIDESSPLYKDLLGACVLDNKIYVMGGYGGTNPKDYWTYLDNVDIYDPLSKSWTKKTPMPYPNYGFSQVEFNNKIYLFGGAEGSGIDVLVYDPSKDNN